MTKFIFGVIADIQHGDKDTGGVEGRVQRYREGAFKAAKAVQEFIRRRNELICVLDLGDILDGNTTPEKTAEDFEAVAAAFDPLKEANLPAWHVIGNHCLRVGREQLLDRFEIPSNYYSKALAPGWRLVVLDTTEMSPHSGYSEDSTAMKECRAFQETHPAGEHINMVPWNGGITSTQLRWLQDELTSAEAKSERVIVASHHPIGAGCARDTHMAWDAPNLQQVLLGSKSFALALNGHDHMGGYAQHDGRHFITLQAILEAPEGGNAYAFIQLDTDKIVVEGHGTVPSRVLQLC